MIQCTHDSTDERKKEWVDGGVEKDWRDEEKLRGGKTF